LTVATQRASGGRRRDRGLAVTAIVAVALLVGGCDYLTSLGLAPGTLGSGAPGFSFDPNDPAVSFDPSDPGSSFDPSDPGSSFDPDAPGAPKATFSHGKATVTIGSDVVALDRIVGSGYLSDEYGGQASWTNGSGWYVQAFGISPDGSAFGDEAFVSLDRIVDGNHWTVGDPSSCKITVTRADETGLAGSADCTGLRWADLMASYASPSGPAYVQGQPAFDAKVTFEAAP
jgi:hypothetical protein